MNGKSANWELIHRLIDRFSPARVKRSDSISIRTARLEFRTTSALRNAERVRSTYCEEVDHG